MGSACEDIFSKKCCNYPDQNLEIHLTNQSNKPLTIPSFCDFSSGDSEREEKLDRVDYLMPHGSIRLEPGKSSSYYCYMDENKFRRYTHVIFYDEEGREYRTPLDHL
jgi:hypothetical protein